MATGLPAVSTDTFDPLEARDLISTGSSADELISAMEYELETDSLDKRTQRVEFAKKNTWSARVADLFKIIENTKNMTNTVVRTVNTS